MNNPHDDSNTILPTLNKDDCDNEYIEKLPMLGPSGMSQLERLSQRKDLLTEQIEACRRTERRLLEELAITELKIDVALDDANLSSTPASSSSAAGPSNHVNHPVLNKELGTSGGGMFSYRESRFPDLGAANKDELFIKPPQG